MKEKVTPNFDEDFVFDYNAAGAVYDIDTSPKIDNRWCEYIGYRGPGLTKMAFSNISYGDITDTELQVAKFGIFDPKKAGLVKIIPPQEWIMQQNTSTDLVSKFKIKNPISQTFNCGGLPAGSQRQFNIEHKKTYSG